MDGVSVSDQGCIGIYRVGRLWLLENGDGKEAKEPTSRLYEMTLRSMPSTIARASSSGRRNVS